jgi:hypothetical protein
MKFPHWLKIYGPTDYRGQCPKEDAELATAISWLRRTYPDSLGALVVHIPNEGRRTPQQAARAKALGLTTGAADIVIPGVPALVLEVKRRDHTASTWQAGQVEYLHHAHQAGCFVGVCLGAEGVKEAVACYILNTIT